MDDDFPANGIEAFKVETWIQPNPSSIKSLWQWNSPEDTLLRVAICGVSGTGKRALAEAIGEEVDLKVIEGITSTVRDVGGKLGSKSDWLDEFMIFLGQVWEEIEYEEFVSAGSIIDIVSHCHYLVERLGDQKSKFALRALANVCHNMSNNAYSVVLYIPYEKGSNPRDDEYLAEMDRITRHYLDAYDLDYFPVQAPNNEARAKLSIDYMREFGLLGN